MNIGDIKSDINFLCGSTSGTYPDADKVRNINNYYQRVATLIWESDGTWNYDDNNKTDAPIAYRTLGNLSGSYLIPTTAIRIRQVEVKDADGNWNVLKPITYDELTTAPEEFLTGGGLPTWYNLDGTQITLYPAPTSGYVTLSSGMSVKLSREVDGFAVTASTSSPGFPAAFHRILSYAASLDYVKDAQDRQFLMEQKDRLEKGLTRFYTHRSDDHPPILKPRGKQFWRGYM